METNPFRPSFPFSTLAAVLIVAALFLVAAAFSASPELIVIAVVSFMSTVAVSMVLITRELARAAAERGLVPLRPSRPTAKKERSIEAPPQKADAGLEDEETLRLSQKAEAVERLRDGIVHDLNNRLMVVSANIDAVARQMKDQPILQRKLLSALVASDQAATLIARSTAFSRHHTTDVQNIDLGERIESVAALLSRSLLRDTVKLRVSLAENLWSVSVDPEDLETAIVTLSGHARDALKQGGSIRIKATNVNVRRGDLGDALIHGEYVRLLIESRNAEARMQFQGMPEDAIKLDRIDTESWMKLHRGLQFMQRLGGVTEVHGTERGLAISVYFKRAQLPARLKAGLSEDETPPMEIARTAIEILVVDDEVEVALAVQSMLEKFGYVTHVATDGAQALRSLSAGKPDLVLMDVSMPGTMDGVMLAREVRQSHSDLPVVLFTGNPNVSEQQSEFPLLQKPIVSRELHAAIQRELRFAGETKVVPLFPHQARRAP